MGDLIGWILLVLVVAAIMPLLIVIYAAIRPAYLRRKLVVRAADRVEMAMTEEELVLQRNMLHKLVGELKRGDPFNH
jgi:hypothetical protein